MNPPLDVKQEGQAVALKPEAAWSDATRKSLVRFAIFIVGLSICFWSPVASLVRRTFETQLYSHILLIPFISLYLGWFRRGTLPALSPRSVLLASIPLGLGMIGLVSFGVAKGREAAMEPDDFLALAIASFVCFLWGGGLLILGTATARALAFPLAFLVFLIPFPAEVTHWIEMFFQHTTASVSHLFFLISGTPVLRDGTVFQLPGLVIRVAEECSGIRSSLVLFITSLVAGCLFLRSPWKRTILTVAVIPLGIIRNAFRVLTISLLSVHVDPNIIDSPIHHRGGPIFFLLSLVPFFFLLHWLRKSEQTPKPVITPVGLQPTPKIEG